MIFTRKRFERELDKRMHEEHLRQMMNERLDRMEKRLCVLDDQIGVITGQLLDIRADMIPKPKQTKYEKASDGKGGFYVREVNDG